MQHKCANVEDGDTAYDFLLAQQEQIEFYLEQKMKQAVELTSWLGLCFYSDDILFVTPISGVQGVIHIQKITPMPGASDKWIGMSAYKDKALPIIHLDKIFWGLDTKIQQGSRIIVYKSEETYWGILVSAVDGLRRFEYKNKEPVTLDKSVPYSPFVKHVCFQDEQRCAILSVDSLVKKISQE